MPNNSPEDVSFAHEMVEELRPGFSLAAMAIGATDVVLNITSGVHIHADSLIVNHLAERGVGTAVGAWITWAGYKSVRGSRLFTGQGRNQQANNETGAS
ncbi:MAG TPA: hypothetical protein VNG32_00940 [Candidatus Dormibacteraeota bacterium]|nr:hypothetical protein [Candidatus Dormibacteraeota bacterium]